MQGLVHLVEELRVGLGLGSGSGLGLGLRLVHLVEELRVEELLLVLGDRLRSWLVLHNAVGVRGEGYATCSRGQPNPNPNPNITPAPFWLASW